MRGPQVKGRVLKAKDSSAWNRDGGLTRLAIWPSPITSFNSKFYS
jgi:hypothetical protein